MSAARYREFLEAKATLAEPAGFEPKADAMAPAMKPFQRDITEWALRRGRAALFEGTGLGKTVQELTWARAVNEETHKPVCILTPLAVAEQTVLEAEKFEIEGVAYAADQSAAKTPIVVTNYDRAHLFDFSKFGGVVLDESSILKAHDGKTRMDLQERCARVPYLLPATATPAPNDWTEIGQHAEFLGVMSAKEMLAMYFVHDGSIRSGPVAEGDGWRLKRHAENDFWRWVASWAVMIRSPADLGYDEPGYALPPLNKHQVTVPVAYEPGGGTLFPLEARTLSERIGARRRSIAPRVEATSRIVSGRPDEPWLFWCALNDEADAMAEAIGGVQVAGAESREEKRRKLIAFSRGDIQRLVTKPSIAGFGMNWQHCRSMAFVGLNDSFEQVYQAVRRCWRFGQTRAVDAYMVASEIEGAVVANQDRKERDFERMQAAMAAHMADFTKREVRGGRVQVSSFNPTKPMELPAWLTA